MQYCRRFRQLDYYQLYQQHQSNFQIPTNNKLPNESPINNNFITHLVQCLCISVYKLTQNFYALFNFCFKLETRQLEKQDPGSPATPSQNTSSSCELNSYPDNLPERTTAQPPDPESACTTKLFATRPQSSAPPFSWGAFNFNNWTTAALHLIIKASHLIIAITAEHLYNQILEFAYPPQALCRPTSSLRFAVRYLMCTQFMIPPSRISPSQNPPSRLPPPTQCTTTTLPPAQDNPLKYLYRTRKIPRRPRTCKTST